MTATLASTSRPSVRTTVRVGADVRTPTRTSPSARPTLGGPSASPAVPSVVGRTAAASSCRVVSPARQKNALVLKFKVAAVAVVALVGVGMSASEFSSWTQPDPAVDYVVGDPAWAHVSGR